MEKFLPFWEGQLASRIVKSIYFMHRIIQPLKFHAHISPLVIDGVHYIFETTQKKALSITIISVSLLALRMLTRHTAQMDLRDICLGYLITLSHLSQSVILRRSVG